MRFLPLALALLGCQPGPTDPAPGPPPPPDGRFTCGAGDPEDFLFRGTREPDGTRQGDQDAFIERLARTGSNALYLMAIRSHGGDGTADHNPFVDPADPTSGLSEAVLDQWEGWFEDLDAAGITTWFFLYDDGADPWGSYDTVTPAEEAFVRALVERFAHHDNWVWAIGEEYAEAISPRRASELAQLVRQIDGRHPIALHQNHASHFELAGSGHFDIFAMQYNISRSLWVGRGASESLAARVASSGRDDADELHLVVAGEVRRAAGRYDVTLAETYYFDRGARARHQAWAVALAGGEVLAFFKNDLSLIDDADLEDCGRLARFMGSVGHRGLEPRDDLASGATQYVLARPGFRWVIYARRAGPLGVRDVEAGHYALHWFDPVSGASKRATTRHEGGAWVLERPLGMGDEVALHIERAGVR